MEFLKTTENDNLTEVMRRLLFAELIHNAEHPAAMVRAFVLLELAARGRDWESLRAHLLSSHNRQTILRGLATVTLFVLGEMIQSDSDKSARARQVLGMLSAKERADFADYARESIIVQRELQAA